ncbi:MAG: M56 family metallopeptidase [Bacteroidales bacterium]|nr:M56 family metallopeptidase [Bacteroidales bacterium]
MSFSLINILESTSVLAIFYLFYSLSLKKETFFRLNRWYLICSLLFGAVVPYVNLNLGFPEPFFINTNFYEKVAGFKQGYNELNAVIIYAYSGKLTWIAIQEYVLAIYYLGILISSVFFVFGLGRILLLILRNSSIKLGKYRIIETSETIVPFSLFKWIIINPEKHSSEDMEQIIAHEKMHAFQLHSLDLIFVEVLVILFWFNPFIYWYRKSIREVHEYLADQAVVENGYDHIDYQKLLLSQAAGGRFLGLTNRFSYSLSKNRLKMLTMIKSKNISKTKFFLAIPFAIAFIFFFVNSSDLVKASIARNFNSNSIELNDTIAENQTDDTIEGEVYFTVDEMPKFNGKDQDEFRFFIQKNLRYPIEAQKNDKEGRIFVSFVVDKEGYVKNVKVERGVYPSLDQEAIRVVKLSPKWEPGIKDGKSVNVKYTFPIIFKLK